MTNKIAFLFSGQGSQYIGMGKDLYHQYPYVKEMYNEASQILGYDLTEICFNENDLINQTKYTQPAIVVTSCAIHEVVKREFAINPVVMAGFSLGEYTALYAAGVFDFKTIINLIKLRSSSMHEATLKAKGSMAAIIGLDRLTLEKLCQEVGNVQIANYNCPNQLVVGGLYDSVSQLCEKAKEHKARRAIVLNVSGAFHTPLMASAALTMYEEIKQTKYQRPSVDVIMNCNAQTLNMEVLPELMKKQIESSVYFEDSINKMINDYHVNTFIEMGPGSVLTGFVKKIDSTLKTINIDKLTDLEIFKTEDL